MYKQLLLILYIFTALTTQAQSAKEILQQTATKVNNANLIEVTFETTSDGQKANGMLVLSKEKFRIAADDYGVWYNGSDMWTYNGSIGETSLTNPTIDELLEINPFDIINHYQQRYKVTLKSKSSPYVVEFTPLSSGTSIKKASISIAPDYLPKTIDFVFSNGTKAKIDIKNISIDGRKAQAQEFVYPESQFPDIEVIDLR